MNPTFETFSERTPHEAMRRLCAQFVWSMRDNELLAVGNTVLTWPSQPIAAFENSGVEGTRWNTLSWVSVTEESPNELV